MKNSTQVANKKAECILSEVREYMKAIFGTKLKKVILFGSYARNEANDESDIDILLLLDEKQEKIKQYHDNIVNVMVDLSLKYGIVISIMEQEYQKYEKYSEFVPFYINIDNEGVEFYAG